MVIVASRAKSRAAFFAAVRSYSDPLNNPIGALTSPPILGCSLVRRLPDDADLILGKLMVDAHKRQFLNGGLGDQQAVERISMMLGCAQVPKAWFRCIGKTWKALAAIRSRQILGIGIPTPDHELARRHKPNL